MINQQTKKAKLGLKILTALVFSLTLLLYGCKETPPSDEQSLLEQCRVYLDEGEWSDAVDACESAGGDEGYHKAAQAYMAKGGFSLYQLMLALVNDPTKVASIMFDFIPGTAANKSGFKTALTYLMGPKISTKSQEIYLESILVSSVLIFGELKDVFTLDITNDTFTMCSLDATSGSPSACGFTIGIDATPTLSFSGFGSSFYTNLCDNAEASHDGLFHAPLNYDVTNDYCNVQVGSILQYHKAAHDAFVPSGRFVDGSGDILDILDFYTMFDSGFTGDVSGNSLCHPGYFAASDISPDDGKIYDCEILGAMLDPSNDLIN